MRGSVNEHNPFKDDVCYLNSVQSPIVSAIILNIEKLENQQDWITHLSLQRIFLQILQISRKASRSEAFVAQIYHNLSRNCSLIDHLLYPFSIPTSNSILTPKLAKIVRLARFQTTSFEGRRERKIGRRFFRVAFTFRKQVTQVALMAPGTITGRFNAIELFRRASARRTRRGGEDDSHALAAVRTT